MDKVVWSQIWSITDIVFKIWLSVLEQAGFLSVSRITQIHHRAGSNIWTVLCTHEMPLMDENSLPIANTQEYNTLYCYSYNNELPLCCHINSLMDSLCCYSHVMVDSLCCNWTLSQLLQPRANGHSLSDAKATCWWPTFI